VFAAFNSSKIQVWVTITDKHTYSRMSYCKLIFATITRTYVDSTGFISIKCWKDCHAKFYKWNQLRETASGEWFLVWNVWISNWLYNMINYGLYNWNHFFSGLSVLHDHY